MATILTPEATLSFPALFAPKPQGGVPGGKMVYSCSLLFDAKAQASAEYKAMQNACIDAAKAKFGRDVALKSLIFPFRDAGEKEYNGYEDGWTYISPWSEKRPGVVDSKVQAVIDPSSVYAGQRVRAAISTFAWKNTGRMGVSFGLGHVQIVKDGDRIDGSVSADKVFKPIEDSDSPF